MNNFELLKQMKMNGYTYLKFTDWSILHKCDSDYCTYRRDNLCYDYRISCPKRDMYCAKKIRFAEPEVPTINIKELFIL